MSHREVIILGAGMVGVCSALALQKQGYKVTLLDRKPPGTETSFGNAGIITPSSLIPFNNPRLFKQLPKFLTHQNAGFSYSARYVLAEMSSMFRFLWHARSSSTEQRIKQLYALIERSMYLHQQMQGAVSISASSASLRDTGWLKLYRSKAAYQNAQFEFDIYQQYGIETKTYSSDQLTSKIGCIGNIYYRGLNIQQALSVASPGLLVKHYYQQFMAAGGEFVTGEVTTFSPAGKQWMLSLLEQDSLHCESLVIAAGPWSKQLLNSVGIKLPMIFERGAHREYHYSPNMPSQQRLDRPIHDVEASFVATPIENGLRLCCGVELNQRQAKYSDRQIEAVERRAREALYISEPFTSQWQGTRPTMVDSLPVIGESKYSGLWLNTGHQHIGFSTGPACAEILADKFSANTVNQIDAYSPARFAI